MSPSSAPPPDSFSLVARGVAREHGPFTVLDGVDVDVGPRTRLGVVGPNGAGKTTLLRVLAGVEAPDRGTVARTPPSLHVGYLPQEPERRPDERVRDLLARRSGAAAVERELEHAAGGLASGAPGADDRYADALQRYLDAGGADFEPRMRTVAADVGLPERLLDAPMTALSGGEAARASLAAILLSRFDVLLLDEPTNNLDFEGLARLERFVRERTGGVVLVSHDRAFLEQTVTRVLELDEHTRGATEFGGGWAGYLEARATARRHAEEDYADYSAKRQQLEARARTQRQWAVQGVKRGKVSNDNDKAQRDFRLNRTEKQASKARASERALARLEAVKKPWEGWDLRYQVASAPRSGAVVMRLEHAVVQRGDFRLGPVDLEIGWQDRVAITGPNGSGKTTLLLALLGRLPLAAGSRMVGRGVVIGEMDQARAAFSTAGSLLDAFVGATGLAVHGARSQLAKFGLGAAHVTRPSSTLSPGEQTRAVMARFATQGVNCLVLDEPTNHLDLPAIEQLELALEGFAGTLLLVTHDRRLLDAVSTTRSIDARGEPVAEPPA
jgi:ATPase subunit of ABC transporter with duplicated ATPase domains